MLETIREYADERLEHLPEAETLRDRHAEYFLRLAEEAEPHLTASPEQASWLGRLDDEHENLRLALDFFRRTGTADEELRLVGALARFWYLRGYLREGSSRAEEALAAHSSQALPRMKALYAAALLAHRLGEYERADMFARERLALARRLEDTEQLAGALVGLGVAANALGDVERETAAYAEAAALARAGGFLWILGVATANLGSSAQEQGEYAQARVRLEESLDIFGRIGADKYIAETLCNLGIVAAREGRYEEAEALLRRSIGRARAVADKETVIWCMEELAALAASGGAAGRAARLTGAVETLREETGHASPPEQRRVDEQTRSALASALDEERLAAALTAGRELTFEQAVAYALGADPA
jgi:tetratricopeptide (TPR) repeat protein